MRDTSGRIVLSLAAAALVGGPFFSLVVAPRLGRLPVEFRDRQVSEGTGVYLDDDRGFSVVGPVRLRNIHDLRGLPESSSSDIAVWVARDRFVDLDHGREVDSATARYALDRTTARSVACCGADQGRDGALVQAFPRHTDRTSYPWWDASAERAFVARFVREESLHGLRLYRFHVSVAPTMINRVAVPPAALGRSGTADVELDWWYRSETDLWVEPATGVIVKGSQQADQWLANSKGSRRLTVATTDLVDTADTVSTNIRRSAEDRSALHAREAWPLVLGPLIAVMLVAVNATREAELART